MPDGEIITGTVAIAGRLDKALAGAADLSRERVKGLIAAGAVQIDGMTARNGSAKVKEGAAYSISLPPPEMLAAEPQDIPLDVVFEDQHLIVINKPAGMVVHPAAGNRDGTLVNALLFHCKGQLSGINGVARPGIVHRIDKDTSGLLVVAKSDAAHEGLAKQFADHSIIRRYLAVCAGHPIPASGTITGRIGRSDRDRKKMAVLPDVVTRGKHAVTHYEVRQRLNHASLIECRLETGRTSAFTARQSVMRYWETLSTDALRRASGPFSRTSVFGVRHCMRHGWDSDILSALKPWISAPNCPPICGN